MSQRLGLKAQIAHLRAENAAMRELLEAGKDSKDAARAPIDIEATRGTRDRLAVSALIMHHLDPHEALEELGYPVRTMPLDLRRSVAHEIFENDRVRELLRETLKPAEDAKDAIVARLVDVALYGENPQCVQAFAHLAKACGWFQRTPPTPKVERAGQFDAASALVDDLAAFAHEPEPAAIAHVEEIPDRPMPADEDAPPALPPYPTSARSARGAS